MNSYVIAYLLAGLTVGIFALAIAIMIYTDRKYSSSQKAQR
jgi:hypothetical protein